MRIGELARRTGVQAGTLRAWERRFALLQPTRTKGGQRHYSEADVARVATVRRLIDDGMTLAAAADRVVRAGDGVPPTGPESGLLQQMLESLSQGIVVGKDAHPRYVNRRAADLVGCTIDEVMARSFLDFIHEEELPMAKERMAALRQGVALAPFDQRLRRMDGTTILVECHIRAMFDRAGRYEGSVSIMRDVTEQRATEAQDRFRVALLDAVGEALMAVTSDGTIAYMNDAAEALWGRKAEEVLGRPVQSLPVAEDAEGLIEDLRAHAAAGQPYDREIPTQHADGSIIPCHFKMRPVWSREGELLGRVIVFRDVREQRRVDEALRTRDLRASTIAVLGARAVSRGRDSASSDKVLLRDAVEATRRLLDADRAGYLEINEDGSLSPHTSASEIFVPALAPGTGSLAGFTVLARSVVVVNDTALERRFNVDAFSPGTRSAIAAPVFGPVGVRGVLSAGRGPARSFGDADADFVQAMANVIGAALQ